MKGLKFRGAVTLLALLGCAREASAQEKQDQPTTIPKEGNVALDDVIGFSFASSPLVGAGASAVGGFGPSGLFGAWSSKNDDASYRSFWLAPSIDVMVTEHLSLGGRVAVGITHQETHLAGNVDGDGYTLSAAPRVGWVIPLGRDVALWPRAGAGYGVSRVTYSRDVGRALLRQWTAEIDVPFVVSLGRWAYASLGPTAYVTSTRGDGQIAFADTTTFGVSARASLGLLF